MRELKPQHIEALKKILEFEENHPNNHPAICKYRKVETCWRWDEVGVLPQTINTLISYGVVKKVFSTNKQKLYALVDREKAKKIIEEFGVSQQQDRQEIKVPPNFLECVVGYDEIKWLVKKSLQANKPVHILFAGSPSTAKSLILSEIDRLPSSYYVVGSSLTKVGLREVLAEFKPRFLIIDEIDKVTSWKDLTVLLTWMERGIIAVDKAGTHKKIESPGWLFASANSTENLPKELLSRFIVINVNPYTPEEFEKITYTILTKREGVDEELAKFLAQTLSKLTTDPRDAVKVARLAKTINEAKEVIKILWN